MVGIAAVTVALFTNRAEVGRQLAAVHGLPALAGAPAILLTIAMGVLVVAGISSMRPWGWWLVMAHMAFLLIIPPLALGAESVSSFANAAWPLFMMVYLFVKRGAFGIGDPGGVYPAHLNVDWADQLVLSGESRRSVSRISGVGRCVVPSERCDTLGRNEGK